MTAVWMPSAPSRHAAATATATAGARVGPASAGSMSDDPELGHHVVVFVLDVVTVKDVGAAKVDELHGDADGLVGPKRDDVLGTGLVGLGRSTVAVEHAELDEVRVNRVQPAAGLVDEPPDLGAAEPGERVDAVGREQLVVDDPCAVAALELPVAGQDRIGRVGDRARPEIGGGLQSRRRLGDDGEAPDLPALLRRGGGARGGGRERVA